MTKMFRIAWPWDYHQQGGLIVMAETKEEAVAIGKAYVAKHYPEDASYRWRIENPQWGDAYEVDGPVTEDGGCDC